MRVFPTCRFAPDGVDVDIERRTLSGGVAISGDEDTIAVDGGGRVYAEFTDPYLDKDEVALAWRAIDARYGEGDPLIVQLGVWEAQMMGDLQFPIGGLPWWEEADFAGGDTGFTVGAVAALRATQVTINYTVGTRPIRAGQWFSLDHSVWRHRAYWVAEVISDNGSTAVLMIRPPLRQAVTVGMAADFADPKCVMKIDGEMTSPESGGFAQGSVRFVEHFGGGYA